MKLSQVFAVLIAGLCFGVSAQASEIIQNGSFFATNTSYPGYMNFDGGGNPSPGLNNIAGWTSTIGFGSNTSAGAFWDNGNAPAGTTTVGFLQGNTSAYQSIGIVNGQTYNFSFYLNARSGGGGGTPTFEINIDGVEIFLTSSVGPVGSGNDFVFESGSFTWTGTSGFHLLDLQDTYAGGGTAAALFTGLSMTGEAFTPEPSSWMLLGTGLIAMLVVARKKYSLGV